MCLDTKTRGYSKTQINLYAGEFEWVPAWIQATLDSAAQLPLRGSHDVHVAHYAPEAERDIIEMVEALCKSAP